MAVLPRGPCTGNRGLCRVLRRRTWEGGTGRCFPRCHFEISTKWVWAYLIKKLFTRERKYLTVEDLRDAFPEALKDVLFATMNVPLYSRWARYSAKKTTILDEYIKNFTYNRKLNPANYFAGLYSKVVDGEYRIHFLDYRLPIKDDLLTISSN